MAKNYTIVKSFKTWFWHGSGHKAGYADLINRRLAVAAVAGLLLYSLVHKPLDVVGGTVLLPLAAVLVGIVFAWSATAQSLLQSDEMLTIGMSHPGGLSDWVFGIQLSVGVVVSACLAWGIACLDIFDILLIHHHPDMYHLCVWLLYTWTAFAITECWGLVSISQVMILSRAAIQISERLKQETPEDNSTATETVERVDTDERHEQSKRSVKSKPGRHNPPAHCV